MKVAWGSFSLHVVATEKDQMQYADRPRHPTTPGPTSLNRVEAATSRQIQQPARKESDGDFELRARVEIAMQEPERWDGMG